MKIPSLLRLSLHPLNSVALALVIVFAAKPSAAQKLTVHLDPAATDIRWTIRGVLHTARGTCKLKSGSLVFDPATGAAQGEILVDLANDCRATSKRDAQTQQAILESSKYPTAFFHPTRIIGPLKLDQQPAAQPQTTSIDGTFNIHGADHPLTLALKLTIEGKQATATTHFAVPYLAWGMKNPGRMLERLGKSVDVEATAHGTIESPK